MRTIDRIKILIKHYGIAVSAFEKKIGVSNKSVVTAMSRGSAVRDDVMNKILNEFRDVNPEWLLTGKGSMIVSGEKDVDLSKSDIGEIAAYVVERQDEFLKNQLFSTFIEKLFYKRLFDMKQGDVHE